MINSWGKTSFDTIYIIENRNGWNKSILELNKQNSLVLCLDFGLYNELEEQNLEVAYLDQLLNIDIAQDCNAQLHHYLQNWFKNDKGDDLLRYNGFDIGDALLLNVLNDITYFSHFFFNILELRKVNYKKIVVVCENKIITEILDELNISYQLIEVKPNIVPYPVYNFPILKWTEEQINSATLKSKIKKLVSMFLDLASAITDLLSLKEKKAVFIQNYHPTAAIVDALIENDNLRVILDGYSPQQNIYKQRRILYKTKQSIQEADSLINYYKRAKKKEWLYQGINIGNILQKRLLPTVEKNLANAISVTKDINRYFSKSNIKLMIPVTNLWLNNRLIMNYCRNNNVPVFMVINGLLNIKHYQEAHDSTWVNCYSESLKQDYFKNADNALPLGDPRMDIYAKQPAKKINREYPTIIIGAAGYNHIDQTSYIAFEFDFLFDVLKAINNLLVKTFKANIILKIRGNGYAHLYQSFVNEYYPELKIAIIQNDPFPVVIAKADLYISFYSQTIIEAAALGIPTIYYKKDNASMFRPYDNKSELVTAIDSLDLENKIEKFYAVDTIFNAFLNKEIIEKYIGPLDGNNFQRNLKFIYSIINGNDKETTYKNEINQ